MLKNTFCEGWNAIMQTKVAITRPGQGHTKYNRAGRIHLLRLTTKLSQIKKETSEKTKFQPH